jgi:hypothetical protein
VAGSLDHPEVGQVRRFGLRFFFRDVGQDAYLVLSSKAAGPPARRDGALNEPDIRARLVSSQDRVCELNYGQVTVQGLKAVMIHDRSQ